MAEPTDGDAARMAGILLDLIGLAGAALVTGGVTVIYVPAGVITAGLFLLIVAWLGARKVSA